MSGRLALAPVQELDEQRMKVLFRRRALYVIGGAALALFAIGYVFRRPVGEA